MAEGFVSILYSDKQLNYAVDDIFISYVGNKDSVFAISDCNEEVTCTRVINSLGVEGLHTCLTACVDYKGRRYLAQSSIPGITNVLHCSLFLMMQMAPTSMILWGSLDNGSTIYADARVKPTVEKLAEKLHWAHSTVTPTAKTETIETPKMVIPEADASSDVHDKQDETLDFLGPVEGRIVRGGDNLLYAVDYLHIAPVDAHWTEAHASMFPGAKKEVFRHRQAIVVQWLVRKQALEAQLAALKEAMAKGETVEGVEASRVEEVEKERIISLCGCVTRSGPDALQLRSQRVHSVLQARLRHGGGRALAVGAADRLLAAQAEGGDAGERAELHGDVQSGDRSARRGGQCALSRRAGR